MNSAAGLNRRRRAYPDVRSVPLAAPADLLRRFGLQEPMLGALSASPRVLDVDFAEAFRPRLVTEVLQSCTSAGPTARIDEDFFWSLTIGSRTLGLIQIAELEGFTAPSRVTRCAGSSCGAVVEFELPLEAIMELAGGDAERQGVAIDGGRRTFEARLPTGADLCRLHESATTCSRGALLRRLVPDGVEVSGELSWVGVEEALAAADPLIDFHVRTTCPECGLGQEIPVDLQELALELLSGRQADLFHAVYRLARAYHWCERDILALPDSRRRRYLELLERESG